MTYRRNSHYHGSEAGFTLIEMLVSTAIFIIVVSALSSAIIYVTKLQRRTNALRTANDNVRYFSDFFSKEIRNSTPNYDNSAAVLTGCSTYSNSYGTTTQHWIQIKNVSGDEECIFLSANGTSANATGPYIWITKEVSGTTTPLAPQQLNIGSAQVTSLVFTIAHPGSYANGANADDQQPYVLIQGTVSSTKDPQNIVTVPFETSISIPMYALPSN
jgi:prepilin-type N-terminal cleavage/methylation domain-containing protein